jgi:hypothetical protein
MSSRHLSSIIDGPREGIRIRSKMKKMIVHCAYVSQIELKNFKYVNNDSH